MEKKRLPRWKRTNADGDEIICWGKVLDKHWNGGATYGNEDSVDESFKLLVEKINGCAVGIVYVSPFEYGQIKVGDPIRIDPNFSA